MRDKRKKKIENQKDCLVTDRTAAITSNVKFHQLASFRAKNGQDVALPSSLFTLHFLSKDLAHFSSNNNNNNNLQSDKNAKPIFESNMVTPWCLYKEMKLNKVNEIEKRGEWRITFEKKERKKMDCKRTIYEQRVSKRKI